MPHELVTVFLLRKHKMKAHEIVIWLNLNVALAICARMTQPEKNFGGFMKEWSRIGRPHDQNDTRSMSRAAHVAIDHMRTSVVELIDAAEQRPLLVSYQSDGTPIISRHNIPQPGGVGLKLRRHTGKTMDEFCCQVAFYVYIDAVGQRQVRALVREPCPMTHGKKAPAQLAFALEHIVSPRACGHTGFLVMHCSFDRAPFEAVGRMLNQHYIATAAAHGDNSESEGEGGGGDGKALLLRFWFLKTACAFHDAHNSLKWSMHAQATDEAVMDEVYCGIAACCNSRKQILGRLLEWIPSVLTPAPLADLPTSESLRELWTVFGASDELVDEIADLNLDFKEGKLYFWDGVPFESVGTRVAHILMTLYRFRTFSSSRWLSVGSSCRTMVSAYLFGLHDVVTQILGDEDESHYKINGYRKLIGDRLQFIFTASLASFPSDAALACLIKDSRVVKVRDFIVAESTGRLTFLAELTDGFWAKVSAPSGMVGAELRTRVLRACHKSIAFLYFRIIKEVDRLPWTLMRGDIEDHLRILEAGDEPEEPTSAKIYCLLRQGANRDEIKSALRLAAEVPWGTKITEEVHASAACVRKYHPEVSTPVLRIRAFIHCLRRMNPSATREERLEARLEKRLARVEAKVPSRCTARQMLVSDLTTITAQWQREGRSVNVENVTRSVIRKHMQIWDGLSDSQVRGFQIAAAAQVSVKEEEKQRLIDDLDAQLAVVRLRREAQANESGPLLLSTGAWTDRDLQTMQSLLAQAGDDSPYSATDQIADVTPEAPQLYDDDTLKEITDIPVYRWEPPVKKPDWVTRMAWSRDWFEGSAIGFISGTDAQVECQWFAFMIGRQDESSCYFSPLHHVESQPPPAVAVTSDNWADLWLNSWAMEFECDFAQVVPWWDLPRVPVAHMTVVQGLEYVAGSRVATDDDGETLENFFAQIPEKEKVTAQQPTHRYTKKAKQPIRPKWMQSLIDKYPWLAGSLDEAMEEQARLAHEAGGPAGGRRKLVEEISEGAMEAVWMELSKVREVVAEDIADLHLEYFAPKVLGGKWLAGKQAGATTKCWLRKWATKS